ncbi:MAG TPA: hypothetical protein VJ650_07105 [Gemmatimonadaceae bacterium]|nr:hypothetical protein [Gemmatimonadaceae bacterium]
MIPTLGARLRAAINHRLCTLMVVGGIAALSGCATSGVFAGQATPSLEPAGLTVRNNNWNTMTVYIVQGGARVRVGQVDGFSQQVFPATRLGMLTGGTGAFLVARPLAGQAFRSENLLFTPGRMLVWTIGSQPAHSYLSVR